MDKAREWTDKQLEKMERKIEKTYKQAEKEVTKKWKIYSKEMEKKIRPLESAYNKAKKSHSLPEIYKARTKLEKERKKLAYANERYNELVGMISNEITLKNQTAIAYINNQMPSIYRANYNQSHYDVENLGIRFNLLDEATMKRRISEGNIQLPQKRLDIPKDKRWNTKKINSAITQGLIQGESMKDIGKRLLPIVNNNKTAAIRNARTLVTGAENVGRLDSYKELEKLGAIIQKVWMATPDGRTRDSHMDVDGEAVDLDEEFSNGLDYPGQAGGAPEEVYNCRCTMVSKIVGFIKDKDNWKIDWVDESLQSESMHEVQMAEERERRANAVIANLRQSQNQGARIMATPSADSPYSQDRKDKALWAQSPIDADNVLRKNAEDAWGAASLEERDAIYKYTSNSKRHNMPLRGYEGSWNNYVGTENMIIEKQAAEMIDNTTSYIDRAVLMQDTWLNRGVSDSALAGFLDIPDEMIYASQEEMEQLVMGKVVTDEAFFSCGSAKGRGFSGNTLNVYCPKGTKATYCEPFSAFGDGDGRRWDGISKQSYFGTELETLIQRGTSFRVIKVEKGTSKWYFDIEVVAQDYKPLEKMFADIID